MSDTNNKTILKNTLFLYARTLILLVLGLYTSRVTMQALGVENYGIINVVGGFVSMFALISGALTGTCQRFITFELGKKDGDVRQIFSSSFYIHFVLAVIVVILAETAGLYFVNEKLTIPNNRLSAANWVFHCSVIGFVLNLLNIPYNSLIIAHERMKAFAYISIVEAFLKLGTVISILYLKYDALIIYSTLTLLSSTFLRLVYHTYCRITFKEESKVAHIKDYNTFKEIFRFAGWAFVGNSATLLNGQGINIIINLFVGVTINAARGIATMIENIITGFVANFTTALNPQITKSYAQKDTNRLSELLDLGTRLSFFLMIIMSVPIIVATSDLLELWLTIFPDYAVPFIRITLLIAIVQAMANPYVTAICATGDIREYQLVVGGITLANIPVAYFILHLGLDPIWVYVASLVMYVITFLIRIIFVRNKTHIAVRRLGLTVLLRLTPIAILSFVASLYLSKLVITESWLGLFLFSAMSCIITFILIYVIGLQKAERLYVYNFIKAKVLKRQ